MPLRRICWSPWPFAPNQVVTLYWIRSPQRNPVSGQWMTTAVVQDEYRILHEVSVPWGFLPWLKLGQSYRNGIPLADSSRGHTAALDVLDRWDARVLEAGQIIPRAGYLLQIRLNLAEPCWAFFRGAQTMVILQVEGIPALVAPTRFLALGCMEPSFLDTIVRHSQIERDTFYIQFSADVPIRRLTRAFVLQVAYLLLDPSLRRCWDALYPLSVT